MKILLTAFVLAAAPLAAVAQCAGGHGSDQAMSCAPGTQWDQAAGTCTPTVAS